jgi:hypothetical protein
MSAFISAKSSRSDTKQAARELVDAVGSNVSFALVYADEKHDLAFVESTLKAAWGSSAIVGFSTSGEITADGAHEGSIVVLAAVGDGFQASTALARGVMNDPEGAARDLVRQLESKKGAGKHLVLITNSDWSYTKQMMRYICDEYLPAGARRSAAESAGASKDCGHINNRVESGKRRVIVLVYKYSTRR